MLEGSPTGALTDWAVGAELLIVGSHALGRFRGSVFSTHAAQIATHAAGSVVVQPERDDPSGTGVVVGVDGPEASLAAMQFAAEQADRLGQRLTAVYGWSAPAPWTEDSAMIDWPMEPAEADRLVLAEAVAGLAERYPDLDLDLRRDLGSYQWMPWSLQPAAHDSWWWAATADMDSPASGGLGQSRHRSDHAVPGRRHPCGAPARF